MKQKSCSCIGFAQLFSDSMMTFIYFNGEFQVRPISQRSKSKRPKFISPLRLVDGNHCCLPGIKIKTGRFFNNKTLYIVIDITTFQNFYPVLGHTAVVLLIKIKQDLLEVNYFI